MIKTSNIATRICIENVEGQYFNTDYVYNLYFNPSANILNFSGNFAKTDLLLLPWVINFLLREGKHSQILTKYSKPFPSNIIGQYGDEFNFYTWMTLVAVGVAR